MLSNAVKQICEENYDTNCGKCPLRPACVTKHPIRTQQDLDRWREETKQLAGQIMEQREGKAEEREGQTDLFDYIS